MHSKTTHLQTALLRQEYHKLAHWFHSRQGQDDSALEPHAEADAAVAGRIWFRFNGTQEIATGRRGIDWSGGHLRHQEWRAQLNRFFFLDPLARAFLETGDALYAEAARDYLEDWMRAHPVADGQWTLRGHATLDLAIRTGNFQFFGWLRAIDVFAGCAPFDDAFVETVLESIRAQLNYLENHLSLLGNWRLCEADSLVIGAILLPDCEEAPRWRRLGVDVLNDGFLKQILPDGAHYEATPGYHHWMTAIFHCYWALSRLRPELGLRIPTEKLAAMFDYGMATYRPDGGYNAWNDSQPAQASQARFLEMRAEFCREAGLPAELPGGRAFPWAKQAALRDGWTRESWYLAFDGAAGAGTHSHLGRNGFQLMANGAPLVVDPGFLSYEPSDPAMALGRSTRAHNTVNLNGWNQTLSPCTLFRHLGCSRADLLVGQYDAGYWEGEYDWRFAKGLGRGIAALHHRLVLWMHGVGVLVVDQLVRQLQSIPETEVPVLELNWQFATPEVGIDREARRAWTRQPEGNVVAAFPTADAETSMTLFCGQQSPLRGWLPSSQGLQPAAQLRLSRPLPERYAEWVTLLVPFTGEEAPKFQCRVWRPDPNSVSQLVLEWDGGATDEVTWSHRLWQPMGSCGGFRTDAPLVWIRKPDGSGTPSEVVHFGREFELAPNPPNRHPAIASADFWSTP